MAYVPYEEATTGEKARGEITKILRLFGCESVGFMDDFEAKTVLLAFRHRGRQIQLRASAQGWATLWLKHHPYKWRSRGRSQKDHEMKALSQGMIAVNSILRDWVKGQVTAVECGMMSFEAVFLPHMLTNDGRPLIERIKTLDMLPAPDGEARE